VEILYWLVPAAVVTVVTMLWVGWFGSARRGGRGQVDRETAARRMGEALGRERRRPGYAVPRRAPETSTGVAVRRTRPVVVTRPDDDRPPAEAPDAGGGDRRAS
jgi:hypothetical protein